MAFQYVENVSERFRCSTCKKVCHEPSVHECTALMCKDCANNEIECGLCNGRNNFKPAPEALKRILSSFAIECQQCNKQMTRGGADAHLAECLERCRVCTKMFIRGSDHKCRGDTRYSKTFTPKENKELKLEKELVTVSERVDKLTELVSFLSILVLGNAREEPDCNCFGCRTKKNERTHKG